MCFNYSPIMNLHNYESTVEEEKIAFDEILAVMKMDEVIF